MFEVEDAVANEKEELLKRIVWLWAIVGGGLLGACEEASSHEPLAAEEFCGELAQILCSADRDCCAQPAMGPDADADADDAGRDEAGSEGGTEDSGSESTAEDSGAESTAEDSGAEGGAEDVAPRDTGTEDSGGTDGGIESDCVTAQRAACEAIVEPLLDDPRLAYNGSKAGEYLDTLRAEGDGCWEEPPAFADFQAIFDGTGAEGADCTPRDTSAAQLRIAALSCRGDTTCHLYLRADGSPFGVCEKPTDDSCSHTFDCPAGERCNLPDAWEPGVWGVCQPLRANGWDCTGDLDCESQYCSPGSSCADSPASRFCLTTTYAAAVLADGPVAYWRLGERTGSAAEDFSGNEHPARYQGGVARGRTGALAGDADPAISIEDAGEYVIVESTPALDLRSALTMEGWFNRDEVTTQRPILEYNNSGGTALGPHIWNFDAGDKLYANFIDSTGGEHSIMTDVGAVAADRWYHVAATYDGTTGRLYLDGTEVGTVDGRFTLRTGPELYVGARPGATDNFQGGLDEVAIYDRALSAARIRAHRQIGATGPAANEWVLFRWLR